MTDLPIFTDVVDAARQIRGQARATPLLYDTPLDRLTGGRLLFKAEPLQQTGSFKFRGAYNRISRLSAAERANGVVAWSSGNHAQGMAAAAMLLSVPATIVMPADAPTPKIEGTRSRGAEIVFYDRYKESREEIGTRLAHDRGATIVPPYDDPMIIAGQGTAGLEAAAQAAALDLVIDAALVPCGGGGLISGCALALTHQIPGIAVHAVEPTGFDDTRRSLESGQPQSNAPDARSICDALLAPTPGRLTLALNAKLLAGGLVVDESDVRHAMRAAYRHLKLVVEPGGAVALAAALSGQFDCVGKTVLVVLSGGNADPDLFAEVLAANDG